MKPSFKVVGKIAAATMLLCGAMTTAFAQASASTDAQLIARGHYLATAADCAACHGAKSAGGLPIATPMGAIYASNITPDPSNGIGNWTEQQFSDALRKGRAPGKGWLYPAMPYTAYTGLSDDDVKALYAYFHTSVAPSTHKVPETTLPFPFMRVDMIGWNLLNLKAGQPSGAVPVNGDTLERGRYLVETLGHCSACHTARNDMMGEISSAHLGGSQVGAWVAPNITSSATGIGSWSDADLHQFLKTGNANGHVAAGDMGLAVEHSFSHLSDADIDAMIAYLRKVPPVDTPANSPEAHAAPGQTQPVDVGMLESVPEGGTTEADYSAVTNGGILYQAACASCHGATGKGTPDQVHPSLLANGTVRLSSPDNLIQVIGKGIDVQAGDKHFLMPRFDTQMSPAQIAAVARYVRGNFGHVAQPDVTSEQVKSVLANQSKTPWLIRYAGALAIVGIVIALLLCVLIIRLFMKRGGRGTKSGNTR